MRIIDYGINPSQSNIMGNYHKGAKLGGKIERQNDQQSLKVIKENEGKS